MKSMDKNYVDDYVPGDDETACTGCFYVALIEWSNLKYVWRRINRLCGSMFIGFFVGIKSAFNFNHQWHPEWKYLSIFVFISLIDGLLMVSFCRNVYFYDLLFNGIVGINQKWLDMGFCLFLFLWLWIWRIYVWVFECGILEKECLFYCMTYEVIYFISLSLD